MNADEQTAGCLVGQLRAVLQVGHFLLPQGRGGVVVDGLVAGAGHHRRVAQEPQNLIEPPRDLKIDAALGYAAVRHGTAVLPAVAGIQYQHGAGFRSSRGRYGIRRRTQGHRRQRHQCCGQCAGAYRFFRDEQHHVTPLLRKAYGGAAGFMYHTTAGTKRKRGAWQI